MTSLWQATRPPLPTDPFTPGARYDSVVVGAGITGISTALLLARSGQRVAVLEARRAGDVTTGNTTGKVSLLQGTQLSNIIRHHGAETARHYVTGNLEGQAWLLRFCREHGIQFDTADAVNYSVTAAGAAALSAEFDACCTAGLSPTLGDESSLPFAVTSSLRLAGQAQFHPLQVLAGLAADLRSHGGVLIEGVRVQGITTGKLKGDDIRVNTARGPVTAEHLILATGTPILDRGGHFSVLTPQRSYAVSFTSEEGSPLELDGMYLSVDSPTRSLRTSVVNGRKYLITGGNGHRVGRQTHTQGLIDDLVRWTQQHFGTVQPVHHWSAQDYEPASAVPYVGRLPLSRHNIYTATGYNKWGLTNAVAAALALSAEILGGHMPWARKLYATRIAPQDALSTVKSNAGAGLELLNGWLGSLARTSAVNPPEGQGEVVRTGARPEGVCVVDGVTHRVSAVCPHLGGVLGWNDAERSWDCPLHGSRFTADGTLLEGPATRDLTRGG
ncbi:FAD-dependent oxidoreductase [Arthrobacter sp. CAN_C5]|uniref:FAD-dependent oxidoreductase n=1 Tax=Arthrobacter sp. CAN_C5 TaxID=2760706 RepID=UPI001AE5C98F|nr:FAD-dependent oxidoreductase [Arthrobacter sp. CAN_C5]MBP2218502.1 glycine/D-amino acid oxidase-like deaminating enzyme/nitrite reductase/ring-hydroxylating ferredoxin subunit [Arthrobacter sp. CAN_C5]